MNDQRGHGMWVMALGVTLAVLLSGCTTPVDVDLPEVPVQGVMEASIRLGERRWFF